MISRIWHGYTGFENADTYEKLLKEEIFTGIKIVISKDTKVFISCDDNLKLKLSSLFFNC